MTSERVAPEAAALLVWVARHVAGASQPADELLSEMTEPAWADFLREAIRHAMLPAATRALGDSTGRIPSQVAHDLRRSEEANARRALLLSGELVSFLGMLEEAGVRAVPWKGPLLAQRAYGDVAGRYYFDLDLLVQPADLMPARDRMIAAGFRTEKPMTEAQQHAYVEHQGELELVRETDGLWVELHTAIVPNYYSPGRPSTDLWSRLERARLVRIEVWALALVDELEALCVHGSKHRWERLAWIVDIAMVSRLLSHGEWAGLLDVARRHGTLRMVYLGLLLAADIANQHVPADVLEAARRDSVAVSLGRDVWRELFTSRSQPSESLIFHTRMRERARDRLRYLLNVLFRPSGADWEQISLPRPLFPIYALTRPVRLTIKAGRRLLSGRE